MQRLLKRQQWAQKLNDKGGVIAPPTQKGAGIAPLPGCNILILFDQGATHARSLPMGTVVDIRNTDTPFGQKECWPRFLPVRVSDAEVDEAKAWVTQKKPLVVDAHGLLAYAESNHTEGCSCDVLWRTLAFSKSEFLNFVKGV